MTLQRRTSLLRDTPCDASDRGCSFVAYEVGRIGHQDCVTDTTSRRKDGFRLLRRNRQKVEEDLSPFVTDFLIGKVGAEKAVCKNNAVTCVP